MAFHKIIAKDILILAYLGSSLNHSTFCRKCMKLQDFAVKPKMTYKIWRKNGRLMKRSRYADTAEISKNGLGSFAAGASK